MGKGDGGRISRLKKASSKSFSYLMVLPAVLLFTLFAVYPFVEGIKLGFYRWDGLSPMTFIGMENYVNILHDEQYWSALKNTFLYAVVTTIAKNLLGLVLAMVMMKITQHHLYGCGKHGVAVDFQPQFWLAEQLPAADWR